MNIVHMHSLGLSDCGDASMTPMKMVGPAAGRNKISWVSRQEKTELTNEEL